MACILIIDDNTMLLQSMDFYLQAMGYSVLKAMDGRLGLRVLEEHQVDVVIVDLDLPQMSGLAVCEIIRKNPARSRLPVIMMTGGETQDLTAQAKAAGASVVMAKPFDMKQLATRLAEFISTGTR